MGWMAYYIAKIGGFNYVAKEAESDPDNPISFSFITFIWMIYKIIRRQGFMGYTNVFCIGT